ncbi:MAG: Hsp20/alpha crystallin family protein [Planctomycetia bacterium]|nr:Hsp20/alpha crystallin family protein [Planctomycetia bacterium]
MPTFRPGFAFPLEELRDELDRVWTTLTAAPPLHGWGTRHAEGVFPAVAVRESDEAIAVEAELPGLDASDVEITVAGDELLVKGSRPETCPVASASGRPGDGNGEKKDHVTWHRRERGTGAFERRIALPVAVDASRVEARLVDGVLTVICPKAAECQPHKVAVRSA